MVPHLLGIIRLDCCFFFATDFCGIGVIVFAMLVGIVVAMLVGMIALGGEGIRSGLCQLLSPFRVGHVLPVINAWWAAEADFIAVPFHKSLTVNLAAHDRAMRVNNFTGCCRRSRAHF